MVLVICIAIFILWWGTAWGVGRWAHEPTGVSAHRFGGVLGGLIVMVVVTCRLDLAAV